MISSKPKYSVRALASCIAASALLAQAPALAATTTLTVRPSGDATIVSGSGTARGAGTSLTVDTAPEVDVLLKFAVSGIGTRKVTGAKLRLLATNPGPSAGKVYKTTSASWSESTVVFSTAPGTTSSTPLVTGGSVAQGAWVTLNLGIPLTADGTVGFRIKPGTTSTDGVIFHSREAGTANAPQLVLTLDDGGTPLPPPTPSPVPSPTPLPTVMPKGVPFGAFGQPETIYGTLASTTVASGKYTGGALMNANPVGMLNTLAKIKSLGGHVVIRVVGGNDRFVTNCKFDLNKWKHGQYLDGKGGVDAFAPYAAQLKSYAASGTIVGHYMIDQPSWFEAGCPNQHDVVMPEVLEQMAAYSKLKLPGIPTIVRQSPVWLKANKPSSSYVFKALDTAWSQYVTYKYPDEKAYVAAEVAAADDLNLGLVMSLNITNGGSAGSGTNMTDSDLKRVGSAMMSNSYPCAMLMWAYDSTYMSTHKNALAAISLLAAGHTASSCVKH